MPAKTIYFAALFTVLGLLALIGISGHFGSTKIIKSPYPLHITDKYDPLKNECAETPSAPIVLKYDSVYTDRSEGLSIVDPKAQAKYKEDIKNIEEYEKGLQTTVNRLIEKQSLTDAYCAIEWLDIWASNDAMLTDETNFQGEAVRKWFLATIVSHYYILNQQVKVPHNTELTIEGWINKLTQTVISDYSKHPERNSRHNNHMYWAAWSVVMASAVLNNEEYFNWGIKHARNGIKEIRDDGILPRELERKRKAFTYHIFAAAPLIMIAETAQVNGINLYDQNKGALHKLVKLIIAELNNNQARLSFLTEREQDTTNTITPYSLAWLEVYNTRFPSDQTEKWITELTPMKSRRLGGNMTALFNKDANPQDKSQ